MARKPRPDPASTMPELKGILTKKLVHTLSEILGRELTQTDTANLDGILSQYLIDAHLVDGRRTPSEVKRALTALAAAAKRLRAHLDDMEYMTQGELMRVMMEHGVGPVAYQWLDRLGDDLNKLIVYSKEATLNVNGAGDGVLPVDKRWLTGSLANWYERVTGKTVTHGGWWSQHSGSRTYSEFEKVVYAVFKRLDPIEIETVHKLVCELLRDRRVEQ